jgi:dTDP-4-amino-4,6-dideoxygalactose transaminase/nucleoside-diphosphate-sugar epimerase
LPTFDHVLPTAGDSMTLRMHKAERWVLVGGSGLVGSHIASRLVDQGRQVVVVDKQPPAEATGVEYCALDLLTDDVVIPEGRVVVLAGSAEPFPAQPWTLALDIAVTSARLARALTGRDVVLVSSAEAYGAAAGRLHEDVLAEFAWSHDKLAEWCARLVSATDRACPPWQIASLCRDLADSDSSGRWVYGLAKLAQEVLLGDTATTVLRLGNVIGIGQFRAAAQMAARAFDNRPIEATSGVVRSFVSVEDVAAAVTSDLPSGVFNVGGTPVELATLARSIRDAAGSESAIVGRAASISDSSGLLNSDRYLELGGVFSPIEDVVEAYVKALQNGGPTPCRPPVPIVVPPRPARPDVVANRQAEALWSGALKAGQRWSMQLTDELRQWLNVDPNRLVLSTVSGTSALRMAVATVAGRASPGRDVAVVPSYTFPATAEVLVQLGYELRFVDVDAETWTIDPIDLEITLTDGRVGVVVGVDTFGAPIDYDAVNAVCDRFGVPFVADSAAAIGSTYNDKPVGSQATAHAYSLSFAKALVAGGAGGFLILPPGVQLDASAGWDRSELMAELHAIAALDQLSVIDQLLARRQAMADVYAEELSGIPDLCLQTLRPGEMSSWTHYVVRIGGGRREAVAAQLAERGVGTKPYFPALHRNGWPDEEQRSLPVTDALNTEALALPISSELTPRTARQIATIVRHLL